LLGPGERFFPWIFSNGGVVIGPVPKGMPVDLLANIDLLGEGTSPGDLLRHQQKVLDLLQKMKHDLSSLPANPSDEELNKTFANLVPGLISLSKCPDYIVNRGHYFGTSYFKEEPGLGDDDTRALIEYLKTF
jgi:hypothetical protein